MEYTEKYKKSAEHNDKDKAQIIKKICELLWTDDDFYNAMVKYAQAAKGDVIG